MERKQKIVLIAGLGALAYFLFKPKDATAGIIATAPGTGDPTITPGAQSVQNPANATEFGESFVDRLLNPDKYATVITVAPTGTPTASYSRYIQLSQIYVAQYPKDTQAIKGLTIVMDVSPANKLLARDQALRQLKAEGLGIPFNPAPQDFIDAWVRA